MLWATLAIRLCGGFGGVLALATTALSGAGAAAGDGGDDGEFVGGGDGRGLAAGEVADVVVVQVDVDEGAQLALGGSRGAAASRGCAATSAASPSATVAASTGTVACLSV